MIFVMMFSRQCGLAKELDCNSYYLYNIIQELVEYTHIINEYVSLKLAFVSLSYFKCSAELIFVISPIKISGISLDKL